MNFWPWRFIDNTEYQAKSHTLNFRRAIMTVRRSAIVAISFFAFALGSFQAWAQEQPDNWNIPWITVGDSLDLVEDENIIITGKVTNIEGSTPLDRASVSVDGFKYFDYTDKDGLFVLELPPGSYRIKIKHVGMIPVYIKARLVSSDVLNVEMKEGTIELTEVVISSRPIDSNIKASLSGLTKLNIQEIKTLPTLMGEVDIMKSLQLMPGVTSVGEGATGINVRGGRVDQNLVLLNDVPIFNTSHALGFVSAFNQDIIRDFSLYKGNVPSNFGGRASSVLEINTRRGDFDKWKFQGGIGPLSGRLTAEGPIKKDKTSLLVSGRSSYVDWILKRLNDPNVNRSSATFGDAFVALSQRFGLHSTADVSYYSSKDKFRFADQFAYQWSNNLLNAKWQGYNDRKASPIVSLSYGNFKNTLIDPSGVEASQLTNTLNYFQVKPSLQYEPNDKHQAVAGFESIVYSPRPEQKAGYNNNLAVADQRVQKNHGIEFALFANDNFELSEKIALTAGLRYSIYSHVGLDTVFRYMEGEPRTTASIIDTTYYRNRESIKTYQGFEPRISARISLGKTQSIKVSYNRMRQYIHLISNTASPTPIDIWQVANEYLPPQIADNYSIGYFQNLKNNLWETSLEFFVKDMRNLVEYKNFPQLYLNRHIETELLSGVGHAYGGEAYIRKLKGNLTGWVSYTYSQTQSKVASSFSSESINDGKWFPSNYNKPHNFNLVLNTKIQNNGAFSLTFSYATGRPFTAVESSYIDQGTVVPIYSDRNKYKVPDYIRMDISLTIGNIINKYEDSLVFSLYNFLGRDNAYSVFYQRPGSNFFIPKPYKLAVIGIILPSLSYNFKF